MPRATLENLMSNLHERFGDQLTSVEQQQLLAKMQQHIHNMDQHEQVDPDFEETVNILLQDIESEHPQAAAIARSIIEVLQNMGV
jgi:hypothetical protein